MTVHVDDEKRTWHTHTRLLNGPLSGTTEARDSEWQWHQLGHMQVCSSLQTDNHASTSPLRLYRPDASCRPTNSIKATSDKLRISSDYNKQRASSTDLDVVLHAYDAAVHYAR